MEEKSISLETMIGVGKKVKIAGKDYEVAPVNISDMIYIVGEDSKKRLLIPDKSEVEKSKNYQIFGYNIVNKEKKEILMSVIKKYVRYKEKPMTEELIIEHGWSFKEIATFMYAWIEISD